MPENTILINELEQTTSINDSDIFIVENETTTYKISASDLTNYIREVVKDTFIQLTEKGAANGVAPLEENGKIPSSYLDFGNSDGTVFEGSSGQSLRNELSTHANESAVHTSQEEHEKLSAAYLHSNEQHARVDATKVEKGAANGSVSIDGEDITVYEHPQSSVQAGSYTKTTVDEHGHVISGSNPTTLEEFGITDAAGREHEHSSDDIVSLDASKLTGKIDLDRLPHGALERCILVTDDTARFALTADDIQNGDTVKVESTKSMYFVVDDTSLDSEQGYESYNAGSAASVPWSGVTEKPEAFTPTPHNHDDRYYKQEEIDNKYGQIPNALGNLSFKKVSALPSDAANYPNTIYIVV